MIKFLKHFLIIILITGIMLSTCSLCVFAEKGDDIDKIVGDGGTATGVGLATWAMHAYTEGWLYTQDAQIAGKQCDCSGLVMLYRDAGTKSGDRTSMYRYASEANLPHGTFSSLPRIHGLVLYIQGRHIGVYLGSNVTLTKSTKGVGWDLGVEKTGNAIDQNDGLKPDGCGSCMLLRDVNRGGWTHWCHALNVKYPTKGFVKFNNQVFYYEPTSGEGYSEYVVDCTKTINGKSYTFDKNGVCKQSVSDSELAQTTYDIGSGGAVKSSSDDKSEGSTEEASDSSNSTIVQSEEEESYADKEQMAAERDLSFKEQARVDAINDKIHNQRELDLWSGLYTFSFFCGILVLIYSLMLLVAFYIDLFNSFTEKSLLQLLTFGKMYSIGSSSNKEFLGEIANNKKGVVYATHVTIWISFSVGVITSALLMNMHAIALLFLNIANWFSNLLNFGMN